MSPNKTSSVRKRLTFNLYQDLTQKLYPIEKVIVSAPASVYYVPVSSFPISDRERVTLKDLVTKLQARFCEEAERQYYSYLGILHAIMRRDVLRAVSMRSLEWRPMPAMAILPDQPPPRIPTEEEAIAWNGDIPLDEVLPQITYLTKKDAVAEAYDELFGAGGTAMYVSPLEEQPFLRKTKEVFGHVIEDQALGVMNCLPFFRMDALLDATDRQFMALFSVIDLYVGESMKDNGLIIAHRTTLDHMLIELVPPLREYYERSSACLSEDDL